MDFLWSLFHPEEIYHLLRFKMGAYRPAVSQQEQDSMSDSLQTCYKYLNEISRSFADVIQALDQKIRDAICVFYLVLRALGTVEDDMTISLETKSPMLHNFHTNLYQMDWRFTESNERDRQVLEDFPTISQEFRNLPAVYQEVIADTCQKMGVGMAQFLEKRVESLQDWDRYCYCVSGLVGNSLSWLFSTMGLEDDIVGVDTKLSNAMGLFLQKVSIIRDYLGDQLQGREFWPREVWSKYCNKLSDLAKSENIVPAVQCLNELVTNVLPHIPDVLLYLSRLRNQSVFNFCAIPQVTAVATLAACYNNRQVFKGVVKIRRGQAVTLMVKATNIHAVRAIVYQYVNEIDRKISMRDPSAERTKSIVSTIQKRTVSSVSPHRYSPVYP
ncbi:squalene synthase-like isoform X2 [Eleutherodactylus coqui]|uniref:Squalene synthase n=1 Tax=Eleutherodactylus coqui TaxID=57060 RepID=A0A8J6JYJ3_ELECQ|nr:hypothetical protein GDO78_022229 [Eleutherodactylus coqui]